MHGTIYSENLPDNTQNVLHGGRRRRAPSVNCLVMLVMTCCSFYLESSSSTATLTVPVPAPPPEMDLPPPGIAGAGALVRQGQKEATELNKLTVHFFTQETRWQ